MKFEGNHELPSLEFNEDKGTLKIWGRSTGTEAKMDFWQPLIEKMEDFLQDSKELFVTMNLEFFATSSAKAMLKLLRVLEKSHKPVFIEWLFDDEDMLEAGEDYQSMMPGLNWKFTESE